MKIGDICCVKYKNGKYSRHFYIYESKPDLNSDNLWHGHGKEHIKANIEYFVLLEMNDKYNGYSFPKILTVKGIIGYLCLYEIYERLERLDA